MNAVELIKRLKDQHHVMDNINGYLFGVQAASLKNLMKGATADTGNQNTKHKRVTPQNTSNLVQSAQN